MAAEASGSEREPKYAIRIAAELVASHPQTLRLYERSGLVIPTRTGGGARLYSDSDLDRIRRIQSYTAIGVNLAGIDVIFRLLARVEELEALAGAQAVAALEAREAQLTQALRDRLRGQESRP